MAVVRVGNSDIEPGDDEKEGRPISRAVRLHWIFNTIHEWSRCRWAFASVSPLFGRSNPLEAQNNPLPSNATHPIDPGQSVSLHQQASSSRGQGPSLIRSSRQSPF